MSVCPVSSLDIGVVRDILNSVDCNTQVYAAAGYAALTGPGSPLPAALTGLLTIYVALLGYRMMLGLGGRLADTPLIAVKIGAILAVTLNWSAFQTLVFNLDSNAPMEIGRVVSGPMAARGSTLAADPVRGLQTAYDELNADAALLAKKSLAAQAGQAATEDSAAATAAAADLRRAAGALLASTVGVLAMAFIATGVLTAVGPVFIALFLFDATRGFFVGWVRALVGAMLTPMVCWIGASLMLVVMAPRIDALAQQRAAEHIELGAAAAASALVLVFAGAQAVLTLGVLTVAGGFGLRRRRAPEPVVAARTVQVETAPIETRSRVQSLTASLRRSSATYGRDLGPAGLTGGGVSPETGAGRVDITARAQRLGETYRRGVAMRDGGRLGAAGQA
jgi:type IV secretion system protein VirB6